MAEQQGHPITLDQAGVAPVTAATIRWGLVGQLLFLIFLGILDAQIISPLLPEVTKEFQISTARAGFAVTVYAIAAACWTLAVGPLSDHFGRLIFLRLAAVAFTLSALVVFLSKYFGLYLLARFVAGLGGGTISACVMAQMADLFAYEQRGRAMGLVSMMYSAAAIIGIPAATWIAQHWGWRAIYVIIALVMAPLAVLINGRGVESQPRQTSAFSDMTVWLAIKQQLRTYLGYWAVARTRRGLLLAVTYSATASGLVTYLGAYLASAFQMPISTIGLVFLTTGLFSTFGGISGGWLSDHIGKRRMIITSSLLLIGILLLVPLAGSRWQVFALFGAGGFMLASREGAYQALISELAPALQRGAYIALRNATSQTAIAFSAAIGGYLYVEFGFQAVCYCAAALSLLAAVIAAIMVEPNMDGKI
ncbi:MAG: MFS transporter [bacterium]